MTSREDLKFSVNLGKETHWSMPEVLIQQPIAQTPFEASNSTTRMLRLLIASATRTQVLLFFSKQFQFCYRNEYYILELQSRRSCLDWYDSQVTSRQILIELRVIF